MAPPFNPFRIDWNTCTFGQWDALLARCKRPTLLQTGNTPWRWQRPRAAKPISASSILKTSRSASCRFRPGAGCPFLTTCRIYRGPLWIYDEIPGEMLKLVLGMIRQRYHLFRGKPLVFHPEMPDTDTARKRLKSTGFYRRQDGYELVWLDLTPDHGDRCAPVSTANGATSSIRLNGTDWFWKPIRRGERSTG